MTRSRARKLANRKRRIMHRLRPRQWKARETPMLRGKNVHYDVAERSRGLAVGGIGAMHDLARQMGFIESLDKHLKLLKVHLPYHESDHVLNLAYNMLCGGTGWRTSSCGATTRCTSTRWAPSGSLTPRRPATSADGSRSRMSST